MAVRRRPRLQPAFWDGAVVVCVALLAAALLFVQWRGGAADRLTAVVYADGAETDRVDLSRDAAPIERTYAANGYTLSVVFCPDGARVTYADCPTQDCVHTGTITRAGQSIVCLPARIVIRLEGGVSDDTAPDTVLG